MHGNILRITILFIFILYLHGCAVVNFAQVKSRFFSTPSEEDIRQTQYSISKQDDVIGRSAIVRLQKGDTLPDIARHFGLGVRELSAANPGVDIWAPEAGKPIMLPLCFILPNAPRKGIVINLAAMRLFQFKENGDSESLTVWSYPVGIGTPERPTPLGRTYVRRKSVRPTWYVPASIAEDHRKKGDPLPERVPPGPLNPLGEYALYLKMPGYLIHGTNKPASIGIKATNGCLRLYPEHVKELYENTPVNTPVNIVDQPYLIGRREGVLYLEVHATSEDADPVGLEKTYAVLRDIERKRMRSLDWEKIERVLAEARGIPVPIMELREGGRDELASAVEVRHPGKLDGRPEVPEPNGDLWNILAAEESEEIAAVRIAAMIVHQGPSIPARVSPKGDRYRVVAGPFKNLGEAEEALRRLRIDLGIEGKMIEPGRDE